MTTMTLSSTAMLNRMLTGEEGRVLWVQLYVSHHGDTASAQVVISRSLLSLGVKESSLHCEVN